MNITVSFQLYNTKYLPKITQHIEIARSPWIDGIVSLPTPLSQIALKLLITENDNNSSDQTLNLISSTLIEPSAKFSSELLLLTPRGISMPTGRPFLLGTADVKSYVVQSRPDDESVAASSLVLLLLFNARLAKLIKCIS